MGTYTEHIADEQLRRLYEDASSDVSLEHEIKIMRALLSKSVQSEKADAQKAVESACAMLVRLVRAQASLGGTDDLAKMLDEVGEEVLRSHEPDENRSWTADGGEPGQPGPSY